MTHLEDLESPSLLVQLDDTSDRISRSISRPRKINFRDRLPVLVYIEMSRFG